MSETAIPARTRSRTSRSISAARTSSDQITYSLNAASDTEFDIDFFSGTTCPVADDSQAETFLGATTASTNVDGQTGDLTFTSPVDLVAGDFVTATATDPAGNTSELADCLAVADVADLEATVSVSETVAAGQQVDGVVTVTNDGPDTASSVELNISLPAGTDQVTATPTGDVVCDISVPGSVTCAKESLAFESSFDVDLTFRTTTTPDILTTSAAAVSAEADPDEATASDTTDAVDASPGFAPATSYDLAGAGAHSVVTGLFDADALTDVVVTSPDGTASFFPGLAGGELGAAEEITVGGEPRFVVAGDFDGDDELDLVVNTEVCAGGNVNCGTLTFLHGNGDGTFAAADEIDVDGQPQGLAAGHMNGDGDLDFVAANGQGSAVAVYLANGDGTFEATAYGDTDGQYGVALSDVDGDGDRDVISTNQTHVRVFKNDGSGVLSATGADYALSAPTTDTTWPVVLDANEDGINDVGVSGNAELLIGKADGTFEATFEKLASPDAFFLAGGDFNGDGRADLEAAVDAPALGEADLVQLRGRGTGVFIDGPDAVLQYDVTNSLASADLNGDGFSDLLVPNGADDKLTILLSNATRPISGLAITNPGTASAGYSSIDTRTLDFSQISYLEGTLEASAGPLASPIPAKPIPAKPIPAKPIPAKPIPAKPIPAKPIPAKFFGGGLNNAEVTPLADVPLSALLSHEIAEPPSLTLIDVAGGWQAKLAGTALATTPLQNLDLNDVIGITEVASTPIEDFDFSMTALGSLPPSATLYGETPLSDIGLPSGSWPALLAEMANTVDYPCIGTISETDETQTLVDLALARCPIALAPWDTMQLQDVSLTEADSPLHGFNFSAIDVSKIPQLGGIELANLPTGIVDCTVVGISCLEEGDTLASAQAFEIANNESPVFFADATFGDLFDAGTTEDGGTSTTAGLLGDMTLGDLLLGIIQPDGFPYENVPLHELLAAATPGATGAVEYTVTFTAACPLAGGTDVTVRLPDAFGYVGGSSEFTSGTESIQSGAAANPANPNSDAPRWTVPGAVCSGPDPANVTLTFQAQPSPTIGSYVARVTLETGAGDTFKDASDPLSLTEPNEPNNDPLTQASTLDPSFLMPGGFTTAGDIDYVQVPVDEGVAEESLITVYLSHFTADDDLVAYGSVPQNLASAPIPAKPIPAKSVGDQEGCLPPGYVLQPQTLENVPSAVNASFAVRGFSTNRSDQEEIVCTTVQPGDIDQGYVLLQITHHTGPTLGDTYLARATVTPPPDLGPCAGPDLSAGTGTTYGAGTYDRTIAATPGSLPLSADTLFLINEDRFGDLYGNAEEQQTLTKLNQLASRPDVDGYILPVENDAGVAAAYAALSTAECSPDASNRVVSEITQLIGSVSAGRMPKFVVIVGGDPIVPLARLQDLTTLGNQVAYADNLVFDGVSNPIARAFAQGMYLSDSPYGTRFAIPWVGNLVYVPDAALGRLVETPDEIQATIDRYLADADGELDPKTALVTGTDSSIPTAKAIQTSLQARATRLNEPPGAPDPYTVKTLIDTPADWTRSDAICRLKGSNASDCEPTAPSVDFEPPGIISWNAHFDHFRTLPGDADVGALFSTDDFATSVGQSDVVFFTIGCNAGVNVPDIYLSVPSSPQALDWAQAVDGVLLANNGYGYGDTTRTAFSERLMQLFAARMDEGISLGEADKLARGMYWAELGAVSPYDVKSLQQATFYGLPMWSVSGTATPPADERNVTTDPQTGLPSFNRSIPTFVDPVADRRQETGLFGPIGEYFVGPRTQVTPGKPIQPLSAAIEMTATDDDLQLRGVLATEIKVRDFANFDPVIARTHLDGFVTFFEPFVSSGSFPTDLLNVSSVHDRDYMVLYGGRFTANPFGSGLGTQRVHLSEKVRGLYALKSDGDFSPPTILGGQGQLIGDDFATFSVAVTDDGPVAAAFVLYRETGSDTFVLHKLTHAGGNQYQATINAPDGVDEFIFQAADDSGNVAFDTFKGASQELLAAPEPPAGVTVQIVPVGDTQLIDGWYSGAVDVRISSPFFTSISARVDGGPSSFSFGQPLTVAVPGTGGVHRVDYETGLGSGVVLVPIDDAPPEITRIVGEPSSGENPTFVSPDTEVLIRIEDPSGIRSCTIEITDPNGAVSTPACSEGDNPVSLTLDGLYTIEATATDNAGNSTTEIFTFQVVRDSEPPTITPSVGTPTHTAGTTKFVTSTTNLGMNVTDTLAEGITPGSGVESCATAFSTNGTNASGQFGAPAGPPGLVLPAGCQEGNNTYRITNVTPDGSYRLVTSATDKVGNATDGTNSPLDVTLDNTAPQFLSCANPGNGIPVRTDVGPLAGAFYLNAPTPTLPISATDNVYTGVTGSGVKASASTLSRTLNTSQVGTFKLTYTAVDNLGNTRSKDCFYEVIYKFTGFFSPINNTGLNTATAGKAVAVKWRILDHFNNPVAATASFNDGRGIGVSDPAVCGVTAFGLAQTFKGSSMLQYLGTGNWQFNWAVPKNFAGQCRTMTLRLKGDASVLLAGMSDRPYRSANFQFKAK